MTDKLCPSCGSPTKFEGRCNPCIAADYDDYDDDGDCYECGGEGFVSDCVEEWACVDPDYGCDYCTRPCPLCNPPKRDPALDAVLSEALIAADCPVCSRDCSSANPPVMFCPMRDAPKAQPNPSQHTPENHHDR